MAQDEGDLRARYAEDRDYLERLMDLEHLLDATLSGFGAASALGLDDPEITVDLSGRAHQAAPSRMIADKRGGDARKGQVLFAR